MSDKGSSAKIRESQSPSERRSRNAIRSELRGVRLVYTIERIESSLGPLFVVVGPRTRTAKNVFFGHNARKRAQGFASWLNAIYDLGQRDAERGKPMRVCVPAVEVTTGIILKLKAERALADELAIALAALTNEAQMTQRDQRIHGLDLLAKQWQPFVNVATTALSHHAAARKEKP